MGLKLANLRLHLLLTRQKKPFPSNTLKGRLTSIILEKRCWKEALERRRASLIIFFFTEKGFYFYALHKY
jgi:hypothetical protein